MITDPEILTAALRGYEIERDRIEARITEIRSSIKQTGTAAPVAGGSSSTGMSAAGRARIAKAQRERWAKHHAAQQDSPAAAPAKPKRQLSAAARKRIVAATKKRWALYRAAKLEAAGKNAAARAA